MADSTTFQELHDKRRAYVQSARENGFEEGLRTLLAELYPDNAHFIYELLQNAEDAHASVVEFELGKDVLTVRHNGARPFSLADVESITSIGNSTKKDDDTQIGKFGVGFKAVFAYTSRPEISSGDHSFAIADLFVPEQIDSKTQPGYTSFTFPFDRPEKPVDQARDEVERALRELDETSLLFLTSIREITYELPDGSIGLLKRTDVDEVTIHVEVSQGDGFVESTWLRLTGPAGSSLDGQRPLTVAAAFKLEPKEGKARRAKASSSDNTTWAVSALPRGDVSIYFPAAKETSGLKFHIHAPFASTVARDSVRDTPENERLVRDIGELIVRHLPEMRDRGLIEEGLLAALPNAEDDLKPTYGQLRTALLEAFNEQELTPVRGARGFAPARTLVASPSEMRKWLKESDLDVLLGVLGKTSGISPRWILEREGRAGKFLSSLEATVLGWSELDRLLRLGWTTSSNFRSWLTGLEDDDLLSLYRLLGKGIAAHRLHSQLSALPIIRSRRNRVTGHHLGSEIYLPAGRGDRSKSRVLKVLSYFDDDDDVERATDLQHFYGAAGVRRWDDRAALETNLWAYSRQSADKPDPVTDVGLERHLNDMRQFVTWSAQNRSATSGMFADIEFILTLDPKGEFAWVSPQESYLDLPFVETGLASLHAWRWDLTPVAEDGDSEADPWDYPPEKFAVAGVYLEVEGVEEFMVAAGVTADIHVTRASVYRNVDLRRKGAFRSNRRESEHATRRDWHMESLKEIAETRDPTLLRTLWNRVVETHSATADAMYRANKSAERYVAASQLLQQLTSVPWVLDREGEIRFPREMTLGQLPDGWPHPGDQSLVHRLDFGEDAAERHREESAQPEHAEKLGIDMDGVALLRLAQESGVSYEELLELVNEKVRGQAFAAGASDDPSRRAAIVGADALEAPEYKTESRSRSVVVGQSVSAGETRAYLREQYTGKGGMMFCQLCHQSMPFKVKGQWYFESRRFVGERRLVHHQNALALCPLCAALYRYKIETTQDELLKTLLDLEVHSGQGWVELPVLINGRTPVLRFTGKHAIDLQAAMKVAGEARG